MPDPIDRSTVRDVLRAVNPVGRALPAWSLLMSLVVGLGLLAAGPAAASHVFDHHVIEQGANADFASAIQPVDFDGDGDTDVVTAANNADEFAWYENDGTGDSGTFTRHVIEQGANAGGAAAIHPIDFDGDGDTDVVTGTGTADEFAWYERTSDSTTFARHVIESGANANGALGIRPIDFDGDGDVDVVTAASLSDEFAWYEQTSDSTTFARHVIESGANANGALGIGPIDFDGDGDTDVVTAARDAGEFAWYERTSDSTTFTRHVIESGVNANSARDIQPVDFDGDGNPDAVTAAGGADEYAWYERTSDSTTFARHVIEQGANANGARAIQPIDFDGDGDTDVVTAARSADEFAWYERTSDSTTFSRHVIEQGANADGAGAIQPIDFDGDGDTDVVTAAIGADEFAWYESPIVAGGGSGGGGGGSCLIERAGTPEDLLGRLRLLRDALLDTRVGRGLTTLYYRL